MKAHPFAELFPMMDDESLDALAKDIRKHGLREPIWTLDEQILDGRNRYRACEIAGAKPQFRVYNGPDPLAFVLSLNLARRHLNESQRAMIAARLENMRRGRPGKGAKLHLSRYEAAERLHVARRTVAHAAVVRDQATPEIKRAVDEGKMAVCAAAQAAKLAPERQREIAARAEAGEANAARTVLKQATRDAREETLAAQQCALPNKRYGVIVADPEWRFEVRSRQTGLDRAADNHYPTSPLEAIKARDIASIAADDAVLFLWSPASRIMDAGDVMKVWGFAYVTQIVWAKDRAGTGYWVRDRHEVLLIGKRGSAPAPAPGMQPDSLISAPNGAHSTKPEVFLEIVERMFPRLPKIELNRRGPARPGWAAWGNEAETEAAPPPDAAPADASGEPAWWAEARAMRKDGASYRAIAKQLQKSVSTIQNAIVGKRGKPRAPPPPAETSEPAAARPNILENFCAEGSGQQSEQPHGTQP